MRRKPIAEPPVDLDVWADALVATASDAIEGVQRRAKLMADNARLKAEDRKFARAQFAAIQRAIRLSRNPHR